MKAEYLNPFIEGAHLVFKSLLEIEAKIGKIYLKPSPFSVSDMIILIGVVGEIRGQVCLELSFDTAKKIAGAMMGGMEVVDMDEISTSAIAELGNMIMGNTCSILSLNKVNIDISPPTILSGDKIKVSNKVATIVIPLNLEGYGTININVTAEVIL
jgi:chemotaxis protein CheX